MLSEVCAEIKNYFTYAGDRHIGDFAIIDGQIAPSIDFPTDYIRIIGSHRNDGVHVRDASTGKFDLIDEGTFHGAVWVMSPPADFIALVADISAWQAKNGAVDSAAMSPFYSESFGGYSYSKSAGSVSGAGSATTWQSLYSSRLRRYRRIREL